MKREQEIHHDKKSDFVEFYRGKITPGYFKNLGNGIFERIDEKTNNITGIVIMGFKKRTEGKK